MPQPENGEQVDRVVRIGAMADLHCSKTSQGRLQPLLVGPEGRMVEA